MSEQDTLPAEEQILSPEQVVEEAVENPNVNVDAGGEDEKAEEEKETPEAEAEEDKKGVLKNWYDGLGPDIASDPDVTKYKSIEEYIKGNREVRKMIGKDKIAIPGKNATQEEKDKFYMKLGRPAEPTGYKLPSLETPEGMPVPSETMVEQYRQKAYEKGLSEEQFQDLYAMNHEMAVDVFNQQLAEAKGLKVKTETALRKEYGAAYEAKIDSAQKVINTFFAGKNLHPVFDVLSNDTGFVRAMADIADNLGEDKIAGVTRVTLTPEEAQKEWDAVVAGRHDLSKAYFDELNPEHNAAVERVMTLTKLASAGER